MQSRHMTSFKLVVLWPRSEAVGLYVLRARYAYFNNILYKYIFLNDTDLNGKGMASGLVLVRDSTLQKHHSME